MNQYDVYGIGNALVDIEYQVSAERLAELGIDKGLMTLVEAERQAAVIEALGGLHRRRICGGSAANSMIAVNQLGGRAFYSCKVADDEVGEFYLHDLAGHGVDTNVREDNREPGATGTCLVFVTPDADRTMNTHLGITASLSEREVVPEAIPLSRYLYIEGYLAASESARGAVARARAAARETGVAVAITLSDLNMVVHCREGLTEMIAEGVDLLFCNESEARGLAGCEDLDEALGHLRGLTRRFVVTLGPQGALAFDGRDVIEIAGVAVRAVDTVGAGDMFAGTFLYGVCRGMDYARAGALASAASAALVTEFGPRLPTARLREIRARLQEREDAPEP